MNTGFFNILPTRLAALVAPPQGANSKEWGIPEAFSFCLGLLFFGLISSTAWFFTSRGMVLIPSGSYAMIPLLFVTLYALWRKKTLLSERTPLSILGIGALFIFLFVSDWFERSYNFFPDPYVRGEIILFAILFACAPMKGRTIFLLLSPIIIALFLFITFLMEADGQLLFSDDHASFLFRLSLLKENFPNIPFFYPGWNAGLDARDFFATGALNSFFIFSPLIYLFPVVDIYNYVVALTLFLLLPASVFFSGRVLGFSLLAQALGAALSMSMGLVWYRWALKYGTMGFIVAACLAPLAFALTSRLLDFSYRPSRRLIFGWLVTTTLMLLWSLSGALLFPAILLGAAFLLLGLFFKSHPSAGPRHIAAAALLLAVNLPWITLFWSVSNVTGFISTTTQVSYSADLAAAPPPAVEDTSHKGFRHRAGKIDLKKSLNIIREKSFSTNPLILFFAIPGFFLLAGRKRMLYLATAIWLGLLGSVAVPLKPQLELDRMLLFLTLIVTPLAGAALAQLFTTPVLSTFSKLVRAMVAGFFFVSPFCAAAVLSNRTVEQYHLASPLVANLSSAIQDFGGSGRTVFLGCIIHQLDEGHVAPLPLFSGKPLVASAPFHTLWKYTQVVPKSFIERGEAGIEEYLDLMNATAVVVHEKEWREYARARPHRYEFKWKEERFLLFTRTPNREGYFERGSGRVLESSSSELRVELDTPEAVLKVRYFPFLTAPGCSIQPEQVAPELTLIKLSSCVLDAPVTISSVAPWKRIRWP